MDTETLRLRFDDPALHQQPQYLSQLQNGMSVSDLYRSDLRYCVGAGMPYDLRQLAAYVAEFWSKPIPVPRSAS